MDYTKNYHLPQWVKSDRVLMEDFNQMCADIESGLSKNAQDAANAVAQAESKAAAAVAQAASTAAAAAAKAQSTANSALSKANAAQASADAAYRPGVMPYVLGSYTGTGELGVARHVTLGFTPSFIMVTGAVSNAINVHVMSAVGIEVHPIVIEEGGFYATQYRGWPEVNEKDIEYFYIAFP